MRDKTIFNIQKWICIVTVVILHTVACICILMNLDNEAMYKIISRLFYTIVCAILWVCILLDGKYETQAYENLKRDMNICVALYVFFLGGLSILLLLKILGIY